MKYYCKFKYLLLKIVSEEFSVYYCLSNIKYLCVSDPTEAEGAGSTGRRQTELDEAVRWIGLPQGRGNEEEEHRLKIVQEMLFSPLTFQVLLCHIIILFYALCEYHHPNKTKI